MLAIVKLILLKIDIAQCNLCFFIQRCCAHGILLRANIGLSRLQNFVAGFVTTFLRVPTKTKQA